ncbi:MAG TPA: hypothetical protein GXX21_05410 [Syntrophomonadaceae bacterium]|nr:hypothetical protein [Syntrophomonadaceae bacterium]
MNNTAELYQRIINFIYLSLSETIAKIPFGGKYLLEEVTRKVGEHILQENENKYPPGSKRPVDICTAYLKAIGAADPLQIGAIELQAEGMDVLITMTQENCIYRYYCEEAVKNGLIFCCPRLGALQSVLANTLGTTYSTEMELFDQKTGKCKGRLFPIKRRLRSEMVHSSGNTLTLAGERAILFTRDVYISLLAAIRDYAPFILKKVLFEAGYRSCLPLAEEALAFYNTAEEALDVCFEELKNCGQGRLELVSLDKKAGHAVIRCYQSFEVDAVKGIKLYRTPRVSCDLLRGELSACLSVILGCQMVCMEMKCAAMEGDYCEFHAYSEEEEKI